MLQNCFRVFLLRSIWSFDQSARAIYILLKFDKNCQTSDTIVAKQTNAILLRHPSNLAFIFMRLCFSRTIVLLFQCLSRSFVESSVDSRLTPRFIPLIPVYSCGCYVYFTSQTVDCV